MSELGSVLVVVRSEGGKGFAPSFPIRFAIPAGSKILWWRFAKQRRGDPVDAKTFSPGSGEITRTSIQFIVASPVVEKPLGVGVDGYVVRAVRLGDCFPEDEKTEFLGVLPPSEDGEPELFLFLDPEVER